jgi:hypothetical protein
MKILRKIFVNSMRCAPQIIVLMAVNVSFVLASLASKHTTTTLLKPSFLLREISVLTAASVEIEGDVAPLGYCTV